MKNELKNSRLLTRQMKMAQLEAVSAGAMEEEEPDEGLREIVIVLIVAIVVALFPELIFWGIVLFIKYLRDHEWALVGAMVASGHVKEAKAYKKLSGAEKEKLLAEVYARVRR